MKQELKNVKLKEIELYDAYEKVLQWFFAYPQEEFGLTELAEQVKIAKSTANKVISKLEEEKFLSIREIGRVWRISCNQEHMYNYSRKIAHNLGLIYESNVVEYIKEKFPGARSIILFGSYRKGDDTEKSDIDIAIEVLGNQELKVKKLGVIEFLGYRENVTVNAHVFSRKKVNLNMFANIANGIVLDGFLEVHP